MHWTPLIVAFMLVLAGCASTGAQQTPVAEKPGKAIFESLSLSKGTDGRGRNRMVLVLTDTDGNRGIAPVSKKMDEEAVERWQEVIETVTPHLQGRNLLEHEEVWTALRPHIGHPRDLSALDFAAWDLHARRQDVPVYELLGEKKRDRILVYWSSHLRPKTFEGFVNWAARVARTQVQAVKVFATHHYNPDEPWPYGGRVDPDEHFRLLKAVRREIGPDVMSSPCPGIVTSALAGISSTPRCALAPRR